MCFNLWVLICAQGYCLAGTTVLGLLLTLKNMECDISEKMLLTLWQEFGKGPHMGVMVRCLYLSRSISASEPPLPWPCHLQILSDESI